MTGPINGHLDIFPFKEERELFHETQQHIAAGNAEVTGCLGALTPMDPTDL